MAAGDGFLGRLTAILGVDASGLNQGKAEFVSFAKEVELQMAKADAAVKMASANMTTASVNASVTIARQAINMARAQVLAANASGDAEEKAAAKSTYAAAKIVLNDAIIVQGAQKVVVANEKIAESAIIKLAKEEAVSAREGVIMAKAVAMAEKEWQAQNMVASATSRAAAVTNASLMQMMSNSNRVALAFTRFGTSMTMYVSAPLALIGVAALKMTANLETATQKVVALAGVSQTQMNAWQGGLTNIANLTKRSSIEIMDALYFVASSGVKSTEILNVIEASAKGAAIGMGKTEQIAKVLSYAYNVYGSEVFNVTKYMDALTTATSRGMLKIDGMVEVMGRILPQASQMGISFDQVVSTLAMLSKTGLNAAESATGLRQVLVSLMKVQPNSTAEKTLKAMGTSSEELRKTLAEKGLIAMLAQLDTLASKYKGSNEIIATVFKNVRALTAEFAITGKSFQENAKIAEDTATKTGTFANAWTVMAKTINFQIEGVKRSFQNLLLAIGGTEASAGVAFLKQLANLLDDIANAFKNASFGTQMFILKLGAFLIIVGPLVSLLGSLYRMYSGIKIAILALSGAMDTLTIATEGFLATSSILTGPILAVGAALAFATGYFILQATATDELSASQIALNRINEEINRSTMSEINNINQLVRVVQNKLVTDKQRSDAIKTINQISPEMLGNLTEEAIRTGEAKKQIDEYIKSLTLKARLEAANNALVAVQTKKAGLLANGPQEISLVDQAITAFTSLAFIQHKSYVQRTADQAKANFDKELKGLDAQAVAYQKIIDEVTELISKKDELNTNWLPEVTVIGKRKGAKDVPPINIPEEIAKVIKKYDEDIKSLDDRTKLFGTTVSRTGEVLDSTAEKVKYLSEVIEGLGKYVSDTDPRMQKYFKQWLTYNGEVGYTVATLDTMDKSIANITNLIAQSGGAFDGTTDLINVYRTAISALGPGANVATVEVHRLYAELIRLSSVNINKELQQSLAETARSGSMLGGSFDQIGSAMSAYKSEFDTNNKLLSDYGKIMDEDTRKGILFKMSLDAMAIEMLTLDEIDHKYTTGIAVANLMAAQQGEKYDGLTEKIRVTRSALEGYTNIMAQHTVTEEAYINAKKQYDAKKELLITLEGTQAIKKYNEEVANSVLVHERRKKTLSTYMSDLAGEIKRYEELSKSMPEGAKKQELLGKIEIDKSQLEALSKTKEALEDINKVLEVGQRLMQGMSALTAANEASAIRSAENQAKAEGRSDNWLAAEKAKIQKEYAAKKKASAVAEAIVNIAVGVTKTFAEQGFTPWAIAESIALAAAGAMQIAAIEAQPMAAGGVVPGGYPHDTYPALLTSGEMVTPPGKLNNMQSMKTSTLAFKPVKFHIEGRDLVGLLEEMNTLNNSF